MQRHTLKHKLGKQIEPTRVFIAVMLALIAARDSGGGEEEEASDVIAKKRLKKLKKINPGLAYAEEQAQAVKNAIAAVTAQEQKIWERENTLKVESTQGYKDSDNKGQYLKEALQDIRSAEAAYREEQARIAALIAQVTEAEKTDDEKLAEYMQSESYLAGRKVMRSIPRKKRKRSKPKPIARH